MRSFLQQFAYCLGLFRALPPAAPAGAAGAAGEPQGGDAEMAEPSVGAAAPAGGTAGGVDWSKSYRQSVEGAVGTYLVLMTNLRCAIVHAIACCSCVAHRRLLPPPGRLPALCFPRLQAWHPSRARASHARFPPCSHAPMVINSPNSANLITAPVPGAGKPRFDAAPLRAAPAADAAEVWPGPCAPYRHAAWCTVRACIEQPGGLWRLRGTPAWPSRRAGAWPTSLAASEPIPSPPHPPNPCLAQRATRPSRLRTPPPSCAACGACCWPRCCRCGGTPPCWRHTATRSCRQAGAAGAGRAAALPLLPALHRTVQAARPAPSPRPAVKPNTPPFPPAQSVVSVLRNCTENAAQLQVAALARPSGRAPPAAADPTRVQQIVEMGFSQAQAEQALRRVRRSQARRPGCLQA